MENLFRFWILLVEKEEISYRTNNFTLVSLMNHVLVEILMQETKRQKIIKNFISLKKIKHVTI